MGLAPKIGINLAVQSGALGSSATKSYSSTETELLDKFGLKSAVGLS